MISPDAIICAGAIIEGDVHIGSNVFIHPQARIIADAGYRIVVGDKTIIEENVQVFATEQDTIIGEFNTLRIQCKIDSAQVGTKFFYYYYMNNPY